MLNLYLIHEEFPTMQPQVLRSAQYGFDIVTCRGINICILILIN